MQAHEIEHYLAELGAALESQGITKPIRMLLIGGAYMMLLASAPRTTDDIDICWLEEGEDFQRARQALRDGVQAIASQYALPPNWFNYLTQLLIYDKIIMPRGTLWKRYGPLQVYAPPKEFILALKILAGRDQDLADCRLLLPQTRVRTRRQAQRVLDRYILPEAQQEEAEIIGSSLDALFGAERGREP
jgi:hypothetical protein